MIIVGHGPSLVGAGLGKTIDEQRVVRLKNCGELLKNPQDYGTRTDVMCASTEVAPVMLKVRASEYWCYPKKGVYDEKAQNRFNRQCAGKVKVPLAVTLVWNELFRNIGGRHPNVSTGMAAIIFALELEHPKTLTLAGFDKVRNPGLPGYHSTVPTAFNAGGNKDTGHDWEKENELLKFLAPHFKVEFVFLP